MAGAGACWGRPVHGCRFRTEGPKLAFFRGFGVNVPSCKQCPLTGPGLRGAFGHTPSAVQGEQRLLFLILPNSLMRLIMVPSSQKRKLRLRENKEVAKGHTASKSQSRAVSPGQPDTKTFPLDQGVFGCGLLSSQSELPGVPVKIKGPRLPLPISGVGPRVGAWGCAF